MNAKKTQEKPQNVRNPELLVCHVLDLCVLQNENSLFLFSTREIPKQNLLKKTYSSDACSPQVEHILNSS